MKSPKLSSYNPLLLNHFDDIIDARSENEFTTDHIPKSINLPVLNELERATVGCAHSKSVFDGHKIGASFILTNVGKLINDYFFEKSSDYCCLVYCFRGGLRSHSLATTLSNIGFNVTVLDGGYKEYRKFVRDQLISLPSEYNFRIISGVTGSGKSKILRLLRENGEQILDLELLAKHKGSVLGRYPNTNQPSQKLFESLICDELIHYDKNACVWVESESKRIGNVTIPDMLFHKFTISPRYDIEVPILERIRHTMKEYPYMLDDDDYLRNALASLRKVVSDDNVKKWHTMIENGQWESLVHTLLLDHYDPSYNRSIAKNSSKCPKRTRITVTNLQSESLVTSIIPKLIQFEN